MALSREQTERYSNDGFLIVEDLLSRQELQPAMDDIAEICCRPGPPGHHPSRQGTITLR